MCCHATSSDKNDRRVLFVVSREDKTLSFYSFLPSLSSSSFLRNDDDGTETNGKKGKIPATPHDVDVLRPIVAYDMPRRANCLAFATVKSKLTLTLTSDQLVVIAGDASRDGWAYPVPDNCENENNGKGASTLTTSLSHRHARQLLLGYTASVLTGLNVADRIILTPNRDERVQVLSFPRTHVVRGYLLGHTSFVSTMDVADVVGDDNGRGRRRTVCVTGSGDGTVRLWDCTLCSMIGMVPVAMVRKECLPPPPPAGAEEANAE